MPEEKLKVIVVMPAYNASKTLEKTYKEIPKSHVDGILLVDDCSKDNTAEIARKLGLDVIIHKKNKGYGANQKTCYRNALRKGADIIVLLHPDYQYSPKKIPEIISPIKENRADVVYGSRMLVKGDAKKGGMPWWKRLGNRALTFYFRIFLNIKITDAATGYIAYSSKVLKSIPFVKNSDGFTFDEEAMIQVVSRNFRIAEIPIPTKYEEESSSTSFPTCVKYGLNLFWKIIRYKLHNYGIFRYYLLE
ncbi:glycosyltransferase family 2 protein [Candidatus Woesearchaeota archaeon]|nr:glycosyltransferase family 2 protein [Candidatus Woesearchaeota archaeon]